MTTAYLNHAAGQAHLMPPGHPEQVARHKAVETALAAPEFDGLLREEAPLARDEDLRRCHPQPYIDALRGAVPEEGFVAIDADTYLSPGTFEAAARGAGGNIRAVDMVLAGEAGNAFVGMRPPGHHAEAERAMGFCLFSNAAIAAKYALDHHGLVRVAVVDFDVHHGNGTQALLWDEARALYASTHQMPLFPGTGAAHERGAHDNIVNVPLKAGDGGRELRTAFEGHILPRLEAFAPELVLISAGFDAHRDDPLGSLMMTEADFAWVTGAICDLAARHAGGRVVSTLEGGYDLPALAASTAAHVKVLMERSE
ncbi:acetoin utilization protein [Maritimibacter sp. 55A14]|uniref:histone deacetylase family protein n=1 Tax=Maritimibacter sp. 55A14 TaxID=2174844 RepID=UPI000D612FF5|nr:histone deacetylase family protein [Maritimibacter sp. 55A14]PWE29339.1 acetoin utilization protein [Maritimibacter sp. 55A14]